MEPSAGQPDLSDRPSLLARGRRVALAAGCALAATALLAACSGSSGGGAPTSQASTPAGSSTAAQPSGHSSTSSPPAPGSSTSSTSSSPSSPSGSSGGGTLASCKESQLRASIDPRGVKNGNTKKNYAIIVDFENTSGTACDLYGYPGAALENAGAQQVKQARRTVRGALLGRPAGTEGEPHVTLRPGRYAAAGLEGTDHQEAGAAQAGCEDAYFPRMLVTPPNTRTPVPFRVHWPACFGFQVHPVTPLTDPPK